MAGHSKWANIKHRKAAADSKKGKVFTRLIKEITVAARMGGGDPNSNPRLRMMLDKARDANMTKDSVTRAIQRGTGELEGVNYEEVSYEGYGPGGIAILMDSLTDNRNRTAGEIRHMLSKHGGRMAEAGSVQWMFTIKGQVIVPRSAIEEDALIELALDAGAEDVNTDDPETYEVMTPLSQLESVKAALAGKGVTITSAELAKVPQNTITLSDKDAELALKLMELLEDHDDVQRLFTNLDISDETLSRLES